jgi:hypothetical protein
MRPSWIRLQRKPSRLSVLNIMRQSIFGLLTVVRDQNEHWIFKQILQLVPGIQEQLFAGDEEELVHIADLVGCHGILFVYAIQVIFWITYLALERSQWCKIWWHEEPQRCHLGLDYTMRAGNQPTTIPQCQDWPRISPWAHWCTPMSDWFGLGKHWVGFCTYHHGAVF